MLPLLPLIVLFALEGLGLPLPRHILLLAYGFVPALLFLLSWQKKHIALPVRATALAAIYLIFFNISTLFFSLDKQTSSEYFLFSLTLLALFIYCYNNREASRQTLYTSVVLLGGLFLGYSVLLPVLVKLNVHVFMPISENQLVFPMYAPHNHLGDFLGLFLIFLVMNNRKKAVWVYLLFLGVFFFFLRSFSRSAYIAFLLVSLLYFFLDRKNITRKYIAISIVSLCVLIAVTLLSVSNYVPANRSLSTALSYVNRIVNVPAREFLSQRDIFARQAFLSVKERPFGVGAGNFIFASTKYYYNNTYSNSAHNLFLEQAAENGLPAVLTLSLLILLITAYAIRHPSPASYIFIYLLVNFQTDYTYQLYLFPVLAVIAAAAFYHEEKELAMPSLYPLAGSLVLGFCTISIFISMYFVSVNKPMTALIFNPLNKDAYIKRIQDTKGDADIVERAFSIAPYDKGILYTSARTYLNTGQKNKALPLYQKAYDGNHLLNFEMASQLYLLKKELRPEREADDYLNELFRTYHTMYLPYEFESKVNGFCRQIGMVECRKAGWDR